jgi:hypothetical protein
MWQPLTWAGGLQTANDYLFVLEWLVYNFVMIFILLTVLSVVLLIAFVYRRHKRHGLGPRIFSLFYIDGGNTKSIGNILCIVALVIAILGLLYPWYTVVATVSVPSSPITGTFNALSLDGFNGLQIRLPNQNGPVPLGTFDLPFYLLIGISLVFVVLSSIGISQSNKLGKKYLLRGIRLLLPFIIILIVIMAIAPVLPQMAPASMSDNADVFSAMNAVSASPFGGQTTAQITGVDGGGSVEFQWGFGTGAYLLLFAGIILIMAGLLEISAHATFFKEKEPEPPKKPKHMEKQEATPDKKEE